MRPEVEEGSGFMPVVSDLSAHPLALTVKAAQPAKLAQRSQHCSGLRLRTGYHWMVGVVMVTPGMAVQLVARMGTRMGRRRRMESRAMLRRLKIKTEAAETKRSDGKGAGGGMTWTGAEAGERQSA